MILHNGNILTMRKPGDTAQALVVEGDRLASMTTADRLEGPMIDLRERTVIPGFCDAHTHFYHWASTLDHLDFDGIKSLEECLNMVRERAETTPRRRWILGRGYNHNIWTPPEFPNRQHLDSVAPEHPVAIFSKDEHSFWVNSLALEMAGITADTTDHAGGKIARDAAGEPTGILFELAYRLVERALPERPPEKAVPALGLGAAFLHKLGVTAVHDMGGLDAWRAFSAWDERRLDVVKYIMVEDTEFVVKSGLKSGAGDLSLTFGGMKLFMDGALGSQTAYMWEPYENAPDNVGISRLSPERLVEYLQFAEAHELACAIHAIGDRANTEVIDAALQHKAFVLRHRIEHAQIVRRADRVRLAESNWIASMQPSHLIVDRDTALRVWGEERSRDAYPIGGLHKAGVPLAFGSDVPVEPVNPLAGIYAACCRSHPADTRGPWEPEHCVDRYTALHAFTAGGAFAAGLEGHVGTLSPGQRANFVILDRDILSVPDNEIRAVQILATFHAGRPVYVNEAEAPDLAETLATADV